MAYFKEERVVIEASFPVIGGERVVKAQVILQEVSMTDLGNCISRAPHDVTDFSGVDARPVAG